MTSLARMANGQSQLTKKFGSTCLRVDSISSTNDLAREMAMSGASEGLCVISREQTAGRGRQGRSWSSPPGEGLYLSLILRPRVFVADSAMITLAAAVAVAETLRLDFQCDADIKWPNDVLVRGRKICGILVETAIEGDLLLYAIVGVGVNIAQRVFPDQISDQATSLLLETGLTILPEEFAETMLARLEEWYGVAVSRPTQIIARWEQMSSSAQDCPVCVESPNGSVEGRTRGLAPNGALIVELPTGERREIVSGEVRVTGLTN
jgi:BirA family biotin operon repressor/biotin-[acetyl-CoA-carboxylase] ligase